MAVYEKFKSLFIVKFPYVLLNLLIKKGHKSRRYLSEEWYTTFKHSYLDILYLLCWSLKNQKSSRKSKLLSKHDFSF